MPELICSHYSLAGAAPPAGSAVPFDERVAAAAAAGFDGIGLTLRDYQALRSDGRTDADLRRVLDAHEIRIAEIEMLTGWADGPITAAAPLKIRERLAAALDMIAAFAPHHLIVADATPAATATDPEPAAAGLAAICDLVAASGTRVAIEFVPGTRIPDVASAWSIVRRCGRDSAGVLVDAFHLFDGPPDNRRTLLDLPADAVAGVQLSDHLTEPTGVSHFDGWRYGGLVPGEGDYPLVEFVHSLLDHGVRIPWSVEVLSPSLAAAGPHPAAAALITGTRSVFATAPG